ncbi:MAG: hypothetical protein NXH85_15860 [Pseudomonadaceae bacterium]|nr:hypothetical protein [Pseudomonadaceae bacterium]
MMTLIELLIAIALGYVAVLVLLEFVVLKVQPDMEGCVTVHVNQGDGVVVRKLYGFDYEDKLYVSSNHWFRQWYYAILENPEVVVEQAGETRAFTAIPIEGHERAEIARRYHMGFFLRLMCGFAPRRFLRFDLKVDQSEV